MNSLSYAIKGLSTKIIFSVIVLIQVVISLLLLNCAINIKIEIYKDTLLMNKLVKSNNTYYLINIGDDKKLFDYELQKNDAFLRLGKLYNFLTNNKDFEFISFIPKDIDVKDFKGEEMFYTENSTYNGRFGSKRIKALFIDEKFLKKFPLGIELGNSLNQNDFDLNYNKPILLGYEYKKFYKLGDKITYYKNTFDKQEQTYVVKGFLKKDIYFINSISSMSKPTVLNNYMVIPLSKTVSSEGFFSADFDERINNSLIFTDNSEKTFKDISTLSNNLNLYTFNIKNCKEKIKYLNDMYKEEMKYTIFLFFIVFTFCAVGIITSLLNYLKKRQHEFGVHLLSGAKIKDLVLIIFFEIFVLIMFAFLLVLIITWMLFSHALKALPFTFVASLAILIFILTIPILELNKFDLKTILWRKN